MLNTLLYACCSCTVSTAVAQPDLSQQKDLQNTFRFYKIKSPLTSISLNKLKDLAAGRVVWRGEIARCKERKFLIST